MKEYDLKIGICACTKLYRGNLHGKVIILRQVARQRLNPPIRLTCKEIVVPEHNHNRTLRDRHCHFFIDVHSCVVSMLMLDDQAKIWNAGMTHLQECHWWNGTPEPHQVMKDIRLLLATGGHKQRVWQQRWAKSLPHWLDWMAQEHLYPELVER